MATRADNRLAECFQRGTHLAQVEKNFDYAHAMFSECLTHDPGNLSYAEAFLGNLRARFNNDKNSARHFLRLPGESDFKKAVAVEQWPDVLRLGLDVLKGDPWHVPTLRGMARACQALHFNDVELVYLKQALERAPKDVEVNRHCAQSLARMGQFDQAIACWHRIEEITGGNAEAATMISQLAEDKIRFANTRGKKSGEHTAHASQLTAQSDGETDVSTAVRAPDVASAALTLSPQQRLERAIEADPADVQSYLKLAELLCEAGYHEKALGLLTRAERNCAQVSLVQDARNKVAALHRQALEEAAEIERQKKLRAEAKPLRMPWLELVLGIAGVFLMFQLFPSWGQVVWTTLVNHARLAIFMLNVVILALLILWRQWKR